MRTLTLIGSAFKDLYLQLFPRRKPGCGFAFLVHPRDLRDVYRKFPFLKLLPIPAARFLLRHAWPVMVSRISGVHLKDAGEPVPGWIISTVWTADMLMADREGAKKHLILAARLAEERGARLIGLGGLTASLTNGGKILLPHLRGSLTTGRVYTAKNVTDIACNAMELLRMDAGAQISIVGAAGSIGSAVAQLLAARGFGNIALIDVGKRDAHLERLTRLLKTRLPGAHITTHHTLDVLKKSDVIIAATNRAEALIRSEHVRPGTVIVDDAQPSDVDAEVRENRPDVLVLQGGVVHAPGIDVHFNIGLQHREDIYSCLAEAVLLASAGHEGHHAVGEIFELDMEGVKVLSDLADEYGFRRGEFQNSSKVYTIEEIDKVIEAREGNIGGR